MYAPPPVEQPIVAVLFIPLPHAPQARLEIPMISAACHHTIRFAIARKMTSCTFIARSQAASEYLRILPPTRQNARPPHRLQRTDHVLTQPDI